jgi:hypothetical protein
MTGRPDIRPRPRACLALALLPLLSGCVGALALPLLAGGTLMARDRIRVGAATEVAEPAPPEVTAKELAAGVPLGTKAVLTNLTELPPPNGASAAPVDERWQRFFDYVLEHARAQADAAGQTQADAIGPPRSVLLVQPPSIDDPRRAACSAPHLAVIVDLDGAEAFAPVRLAPAAADVAQGLARLRDAGVTVLWITRLPAARAADVARALRTSGLDPQRQDQLLLVRNDEDRKQLLRQDANRDVCVIAIAGDRRADFDELFDYLRNPDAAVGLEPLIGDGWFLVPSLDLSDPAPAPN